MTPRIAYCSPVNPAPSGISDYSEELLPYLAQYAEITLFVADGLRPTNPQLGQHFTVLPIRKLERLARRGRSMRSSTTWAIVLPMPASGGSRSAFPA